MGLERCCAIAVMAKAPSAGRVKTRLVPPLTDEEASSLSASFLKDATANIVAAGRAAPIHGFVAFAPAGSEPLFEGCVAESTRLVLADGSRAVPAGVEGFGRALLHAAQALFERGYGSVCLLNGDSPSLPTEFLVRAATILAPPGDRVVLGPADDGGYYVIGLKAPHAGLFQEIAWSSAEVAAQTRVRAAGLGLGLTSLPMWYDVDDAASLEHLLGDLAAAGRGRVGPVPYAAPATAALLARLGLEQRISLPRAAVRA